MKRTVTALEIYEGAYDSAQSLYIPDDFKEQVQYVKDYAWGVWTILLSDEEATKIAQCRKDLFAANDKDGQWTLNYFVCIEKPLQDIEYEGTESFDIETVEDIGMGSDEEEK